MCVLKKIGKVIVLLEAYSATNKILFITDDLNIL